MKKNKMTSKYITFSLIVLIVLGVSTYLIYKLISGPKIVNKVEVTNSIPDFEYTLDDRDSVGMKVEFELLKSILESETIDYEAYAKSLAKLYIYDLYTIDNKINSYDTPCLEYIYPTAKESFTLSILGTIYKDIKDNTDNKRKQELPVVKDITIEEFKEATYKLGEKEFLGHSVKLTWTYEKDLGYEYFAKLTIVKENDKLFVVKQEIE